MDEYNISYLLIIPRNNGENSVFQGFSLGLTDPITSNLLRCINIFPSNLLEIFSPHRILADIRRRGAQKTILPIYSDAVSSESPPIGGPLCVVIVCDQPYIATAKKIASRLKYKPIIVSPSDDPSCVDVRKIPLRNLIFSLDAHLKKTFLENIKHNKEMHSYFVGMKIRKRRLTNLRKKSYVSNNTAPNEDLLMGLGYKFKGASPIFGDRKNYINAINSSANRVKAKIKSNLAKHQSDLIIYSPSIYTHLLNINHIGWKQLFRNIKSPWKRSFLTKGIIKNPDYSGVTMNVEEKDVNPANDPWVREILKTRQQELFLNALIMTGLAVNQLAPAIRLPNSVNLNGSLLIELELHLAKNTPKSKRISNERFVQLQEKLTSDLGPKLINQIYCAQSSLICSNAPIEWLPLNGLPLMICREISKIPVTPGNLFVHLALMRPLIKISLPELFDVLIIRSFNSSDPIKHTLEKTIRFWSVRFKNLTYKIVDVANRLDMERAINSYHGKLIIFDCHGGHSGTEEVSWLQIGDERLDMWNLNVSMPPIAMLSACSTAPITGSHANAANGLFNLGAYSVMGTFLPVNSFSSAAMIGRILYRIDSYLPTIGKANFKTVTWRTCISQFFKMSFVTDILESLLSSNQITQQNFNHIHIEASMDINMHIEKWFDHFCENLDKYAKIKKSGLMKQIKENCQNFETIYYTQLGRPENIIIELDNHSGS